MDTYYPAPLRALTGVYHKKTPNKFAIPGDTSLDIQGVERIVRVALTLPVTLYEVPGSLPCSINQKMRGPE